MGVYQIMIENQGKLNRKQIEQFEKAINQKENKKQFEKDIKIELKNRLKDYFYNYFENNKSNFYDDEPQKSFLFLKKLKTQSFIINEIISPKEKDINFKKEYLNNIYQKELIKIYNYYDTLKREEFEELDEDEKEEIKTYNLKKSIIQLQNNINDFNKDCKNFGIDTKPKKDTTKKGFFEILLNILLK